MSAIGFLNSCTKDEITNEQNMSKVGTLSSTSPDWGLCCTFNGENCGTPKANCYDEFEVVGDVAALALNELNNISDGVKADEVQEFFTNGPWMDILDGMGNEHNSIHLNRLRSGDVAIKRFLSGQYTYYKVGTPVELANDSFEFVLQTSN